VQVHPPISSPRLEVVPISETPTGEIDLQRVARELKRIDEKQMTPPPKKPFRVVIGAGAVVAALGALGFGGHAESTAADTDKSTRDMTVSVQTQLKAHMVDEEKRHKELKLDVKGIKRAVKNMREDQHENNSAVLDALHVPKAKRPKPRPESATDLDEDTE
jgi:hypothetical protein